MLGAVLAVAVLVATTWLGVTAFPPSAIPLLITLVVAAVQQVAHKKWKRSVGLALTVGGLVGLVELALLVGSGMLGWLMLASGY